MADRKILSKIAYIRHGPYCPDGTWAALPFWLALPEATRARLGELLGETADFDWAAAKAAGSEVPDYHKAKEEGLPLFIPANPGDSPPEGLLEGYTVYLLDFCYTAAGLESLISEIGETGRIIILDHHATNERVVADFLARYPDKITAVFDMKRSGAEIAWDYARENGIYTGPDSRIKDYVGDRDTWSWALEDSHEINAALRLLRVSTSLGNAAAAYARELTELGWLESLTLAGQHYLEAQEEIVDAISRGAKIAYVSTRDPETGEETEHRVRIVNSPTLQSEIGNKIGAMEVEPGVLPDFAAVWYYDHGKGIIAISLRRGKGATADLSKIAPTIVGVTGGGGHPAAAGCAIAGCDVKSVFRPRPRDAEADD